MAVSTTLRRALRRIAEALTDYARENNWKDEDYRIYYSINTAWSKIHIAFVAKDFAGRSDLENYRSVREHLEKRLKDEPELLNHLGLVVRSFKQVDEGGIYAIGPEYREYWSFTRS